MHALRASLDAKYGFVAITIGMMGGVRLQANSSLRNMPF